MSNTNDLDLLVSSILNWWDEHMYDTTGDYGEYNIYDEEPEFVKFANIIAASRK